MRFDGFLKDRYLNTYNENITEVWWKLHLEICVRL